MDRLRLKMEDAVYREWMLAVANQPLISRMGRQYGMRLGARRFVAGLTEADLVGAVRALLTQGMGSTVDHLGEGRQTADSARQAASRYGHLIETLDQERVPADLSLKLSQFGLELSPELAWENLDRVVSSARRSGRFVRIDMEDSSLTDPILKLFERAFQKHPGAVGTVLQAYLRRSEADLVRLSHAPKNFRIVKGAYREPAALAFLQKAEVNRNFDRLVEISLGSGNHTAIATHDKARIERTLELLRKNPAFADRAEFEMLYGIRTDLLRELARAGYRTRVYVPYGADWYAYFTRRLAERPANLMFFLRALWPRG